MNIKNIASIATFGMVASINSASALEFGGEVSLGYNTYIDAKELGISTFEASAELGFSNGLSVQLDVNAWKQGYAFEYPDFAGGASATYKTTVGSAALHLIYEFQTGTSIGAFIGRESGRYEEYFEIPEWGFSNSDVDETLFTYHGVEVAHDFGKIGVEASATFANDDYFTAHVLGLGIEYSVTEKFLIGAKYTKGMLSSSYVDRSLDSLQLSAIYQVADGLSMNGTIGATNLTENDFFSGDEYSVTTPTIGLGVTYQFGAKQGTTFGARGMSRADVGL